MIRQTTLPFKLELTEQKITSRSGFALLYEYYKSLNINGLVNRSFAKPKSNRGFKPSVFVSSLVGLLQCGGKSLEDLRELRYESALMDLLEQKVAKPDTVGDWLRRQGYKGVESLDAVHKESLKRLMRKERVKEYTLDMDATEIVADKDESQVTYKGNKGYMPILGTLAENKLCIHHEFRKGNISPCSGQKRFYESCKKRLPRGKKIKYVRVDAAGYQKDLIDILYEDHVEFAIRARMSEGLKARIKGIDESKWEKVKINHEEYEATSLDHAFTDKRHKRVMRLVVKRQRPLNPELFEEGAYLYWGIVTNIQEEAMSDEEVIKWFNLRGESENINKEVKSGFGLGRLPCGQIRANALFFSIGILSYNLFIGFKRLTCPPEWLKHTISTFRWKMINIAGQIIRHGRRIILRIKGDKKLLHMFESIRGKVFDLGAYYAT